MREPTKEETALARLCDALAPAEHEPVTLPEYMAEASEPSLSQLQLNTLGDSADARRVVIEGLTGLARVRAAGKRLERPARLKGEHHAAVARLRAAGLSGREIGRRLGISEGSVRRLTSASAQ